jgi:hypothetical protein
MEQPDLLTPAQILDATAAFFGQPVLKLTAPGGKSRTSFRAYLPGRTVIVSQRKQSAKSAVETHVLTALEGATDRVPRLLGTSGGLTFQSDVGQRRLNWAIHTLVPDQRPALAAQAVDALFEIHRAADRVDLAATLPRPAVPRIPDDKIFAAADRLAVQLNHTGPKLDRTALCPWFWAQPDRFVKWDCRAGNAALDEAGHLRWFDFEDARLGLGPEDFAWLMADETWPVDMGLMLDLVRARLTDADTASPDRYMTYLAEFATLMAVRRIRLIFGEARQKGWLDRASILKYDWVGTNPHMGERLSVMAADLSRRTPSTAPLGPLFDRAAEVFRKVRTQVASD